MPADERSVLPTLRGVPWWGAVLIAIGITTIGALIDSDADNPLGRAFKICYLLGCLIAALLVRHRALFTAAVQPPLIAFAVGVVTLYTVNAGNAQGLRAVVFKVVLPIATNFPWILLSFLMTLAVVGTRWFLARPSGQPLFGRAAKKPPRAQAEKSSPTRSRTRPTTGGDGAKPAVKASAATQNAATQTGTAQPGARRAAAAAPGSRTTRRTPASGPTSTTRSAPARKSAESRTNPANAGSRPGPRPAPRPQPAPQPSGTRAASERTQRAQPTQAARRSQSPEPAAQAPAEPPRRRAAPQTIPARDPGARPRRTAGQVRDKGSIEDLTTGADER